jgi:hypothetical protein
MSTFSCTGRVTMSPTWSEDLDLTAIVDKTTLSISTALTDGTGNDQADAYWRDAITIAASATTSLDLRALSRQLMGGTVDDTFAKVKILCLQNKSLTASLSVGASVANRWTALAAGAVTVGPSGVFYVAFPLAGYTTSASDKILAITNNGAAAADIDIYIVGVHA